MKSPLSLCHPLTAARLQAIIERPAACYMLVGESGSGKRQLATTLAQALHCTEADCLICKQILNGTHDNTIVLEPDIKSSIGIEAANNLKQKLVQRKSSSSEQRVVIIDKAEALTLAAQNALLKVIEEPPADTIFILLVSKAGGILPTIKSRCQQVYVRPIPDVQARTYVQGRGLDATAADNVITVADGRAGIIMELCDTPDQITAHMQLCQAAEQLLHETPFTRALQVDTISKDGTHDKLIDWLGRLIRHDSRKNPRAHQQLIQLNAYYRNVDAGVSNKTAVMELMVNL